MASKREERLQMRQRGAGSRKIKDVDFGFSFGTPRVQQLRRTQSSRNNPTPKQQVLARPSPKRTPHGSQERDETRRASGSSRNSLPERPSTFDIPPDDTLDHEQRSKRRKIHAFRTIPRNGPAPSPNGFREKSGLQHPLGSVTDTEVEQDTALSSETPQPKGSISVVVTHHRTIRGRLEPNHIEQEAEDGIKTSEAVIGGGERLSSKRALSIYESSQDNVEEFGPISQQPVHDQSSFENVNGELGVETVALEPAEQEPNESATQVTSVEHELPKQKSTLQKRGRQSGEKAKGSQENDKYDDYRVGQTSPHQQTVDSSYASSVKTVIKAPELPTQKPAQQKKGKPPVRKTDNHGSDRPATRHRSVRTLDVGDSGLPRQEESDVNLTPITIIQAPDQPDARFEELVPGPPTRPQNQEYEKRALPQSSQKKRRKRKAVNNVPSHIHHPRETASDEPGPSSQTKRLQSGPPEQPAQFSLRWGIPPKSINSVRKPKKLKERPPSGEVNDNDTQVAVGSTPKGETIQITVHRLTNIAALDRPGDSSASANEVESGDELSILKKVPSRSGVNPADVLSQLCRETMEKTLTTIKSEITNEPNPTQRASLIRKRKAVEAYSLELEGRLLELSEVLDSNFILNRKLKKAKKEMVELRNRLLQLRQKRNEVALRMDEVRRRHAAEESVKMARNTINSSLHNLELAVDRHLSHNANQPKDERPASLEWVSIAGLEFLLRAVAENVSSAGPGSGGGLLNQIKAFNARLETIAKKLEN